MYSPTGLPSFSITQNRPRYKRPVKILTGLQRIRRQQIPYLV